jgi:hypothetical protein
VAVTAMVSSPNAKPTDLDASTMSSPAPSKGASSSSQRRLEYPSTRSPMLKTRPLPASHWRMKRKLMKASSLKKARRSHTWPV